MFDTKQFYSYISGWEQVTFDVLWQVDTTVSSGLVVPEGIISPFVNVLELTWFIRYILLLKFTVPK